MVVNCEAPVSPEMDRKQGGKDWRRIPDNYVLGTLSSHNSNQHIPTLSIDVSSSIPFASLEPIGIKFLSLAYERVPTVRKISE